MVLDAPNKEGAFIVESSTFGAGTSIATLADMNDMILSNYSYEYVYEVENNDNVLLDVLIF